MGVGTLKDEHLELSRCMTTQWERIRHRKSSQGFLKGAAVNRTMLPGAPQAGTLSLHLSPADSHSIVFWSTKSLSKNDAKGKLRLSKMVHIPGGNIVLKKRNTFINPIGFGFEASRFTYYLKDPPCKGYLFPMLHLQRAKQRWELNNRKNIIRGIYAEKV